MMKRCSVEFTQDELEAMYDAIKMRHQQLRRTLLKGKGDVEFWTFKFYVGQESSLLKVQDAQGILVKMV